MLPFWGIFFSVIISNNMVLCDNVSVPFLNCGTIFSHLELREVIVKDCSRHPCIFKPAETRNVTLVLINKDADLNPSNLKAEGLVQQFGISWTCKVTSDDPCSHWPCPLKGSHQENLELSILVNIQPHLLKRPGKIILSLHDIYTPELKPVCASFDMIIR